MHERRNVHPGRERSMHRKRRGTRRLRLHVRDMRWRWRLSELRNLCLSRLFVCLQWRQLLRSRQLPRRLRLRRWRLLLSLGRFDGRGLLLSHAARQLHQRRHDCESGCVGTGDQARCVYDSSCVRGPLQETWQKCECTFRYPSELSIRTPLPALPRRRARSKSSLPHEPLESLEPGERGRSAQRGSVERGDREGLAARARGAPGKWARRASRSAPSPRNTNGSPRAGRSPHTSRSCEGRSRRRPQPRVATRRSAVKASSPASW